VRRRAARNWAGLAFALPALALFALFAVYPMLRVVYLSLFDYNLTSPGRYVGLENYRFLIHDARFHAAFGASIFYVVAAYVPAVLLALLIALGLNTRMRGSGLARLLYFAPVATSWVAVSVIWRLVRCSTCSPARSPATASRSSTTAGATCCSSSSSRR
jgi:multiple sugar transport system permease protein